MGLIPAASLYNCNSLAKRTERGNCMEGPTVVHVIGQFVYVSHQGHDLGSLSPNLETTCITSDFVYVANYNNNRIIKMLIISNCTALYRCHIHSIV